MVFQPPSILIIDQSGANTEALNALNIELREAGKAEIVIRQNKYLNNFVEQDHRGVKRITQPMLGLKIFASAKSTIAGIELCHKIRKGQYDKTTAANVWDGFYALAG